MGRRILSAALPIIGAAVAGPAGAAIGGAAGGAISGGGLRGALIGAGTGFAGNAIGNSLSSSLAGTLGRAGTTSIGSLTSSSNVLGPYTLGNLGSSAANSVGNAIANTTLSSALGSYAGNSIAGSIGESLMPAEDSAPDTPMGPAPFTPTRSPQLNLPGSLSGFAGLDPNQQSSNLATQGVYGGGNGPDEEDYFTNMINRRLVDDAGQVDSDLSEINPIESSYLSQLGLGGYGDSRSLLEALSKRRRA